MNIVSTSQFTIVDLNDSVFTPNLLPWSEDWVVGSGSLERWTAHGDAAENVRSIFVDPFGYKNVLWRCIPDADGGASGGFTIGGIRLKRDKTYRFTCFIKRSSTMGGTLTIGMGNVNSLAGIALSNAPVISFMSNVEPDTWYLLVGILHPAGTTSAIGKAGIYNMRGSKLIEGTEYAFGVTAEPTFYVKLDGATTAASEVQLFMPTLECLDGTEESIQTLIRYDGSENDYLRDVLEKGKTAIEGGLLTSNVILAAGLDGVVRSGMSGISEDNIGFFTGGTYDDAVNNKASNIIHKDGSVRLGAGAFAYDKASNRFNLGNFILLNDDIIGVDNGVERVRFSGGDVPSIDAIDQGWGYYAAGVYGNHPDSGAIPVELSPPSRKWVHANAAGYADSIMAFSISDEVFFTGSKQYRLDDVSIDAWIYNESADESTITATWGLYNVLTDVIVYPVGGPVSVSTPIPVTNSGRYKLKINVSPRIKISGVTPYQRCYFEAYFRCAGISQQGVHSRSLIGRDGIMSYYSANSYFYYKEAYGFEARFGGMGFRVSTSGIQKMVDGSTWVNDTLMNTSLASTTALGIMKVGAGLSAVEGLVSIATNGVTNAMLAGGITGSKLTTGYGDTTNPYGSKTAKHFLAAPNASTGVPSFRAIVASDIPTLNQNTTGQAGSLARAEGTSNSYRSVWFGQDPNHDKLSYDSTFVYNPALKTLQVGSTTVGRIMIGGGMLVWDNDNNALKVVSRDGTTTISLYSTGSSAALGIGSGGGGTSYDRLDSWTGYDVDQAGWVLSAGLGHDTYTRVLALEASTPNVAWGVDGSGYTPLSVNGITRQLSTNGHTHTKSSITDFPSSWDWSAIDNKPPTYTPSAHTHDDRYYTETEVGNLFAGTTAITGYNKDNWDGVVTDFAGLEIGGRNLWINTVFDNGEHWQNGRVEFLGRGNVRLNTGASTCHIQNGIFGYEVESDGIFVISFSFRTEIQSGNKLSFFVYKNGYSKVTSSLSSNDWSVVTKKISAVKGDVLGIALQVDGAASNNGVVFLKGIKLEKGNVATDWTPAPEDVDASIATVQTNLNTHAALTNNPHSVTKTQVGLSNVENTALSTWAGSGNITALGTVVSGTWNANTIAVTKGGTGKSSVAANSMLYATANDAYGEVATTAFGRGLLSAVSETEVTGLRAATATKLATARTIFGQSFDGSGNVTGNATLGTTDGTYLQVGAIRLQYDATNNALKVIKSDGTAANFYATGSNTAFGVGTGGGGSSYNMVSDWSQYVTGSELWVVSAELINSLRTSVTSHIGDSTHASAGEKSNWNAAYSHSVVSGGVHMTTTDRSQLTTAYNHSQAAHDYAPSAHVGATGNAHGVATTSVAGFMSTADKSKLDGIEASANNYVHPNSGVTAGTYRSVTVNAAGHVTGGTNPTTVGEYGITDVMTTAHPANSITPTNISNWGESYSFTSGFATNYPDLVAIEAITGTSGLLKKTAANTWSLDTNTYMHEKHVAATATQTGWYKINIDSPVRWMLNFTIRIYQSYKFYDVVVSGYNYGARYWFSPTAVLSASTDESINVVFGYDGVDALWVAVPAGNHTGLTICNINNGFNQDDNWSGKFIITHMASLTGTIHTNVVVNRPLGRKENAESASKLYTPRSLTIGATAKSFDGSAAVSWSLAEIGAASVAGSSTQDFATKNLTVTGSITGATTISASGAINGSKLYSGHNYTTQTAGFGFGTDGSNNGAIFYTGADTSGRIYRDSNVMYFIRGASATAGFSMNSVGAVTFNQAVETKALLTASGNIATANADGAYMQVGPIKILYDATYGAIRVEGNIYATGSNTAFGIGGGAGGGGLITNVYGTSGFGGSYSDVDLSSTFNAYAINSLYTALQGKAASDHTHAAASATASGIVTTGAQTFAGAKTFANGIKISSEMAVKLLGGAPYLYSNEQGEAIMTFDNGQIKVTHHWESIFEGAVSTGALTASTISTGDVAFKVQKLTRQLTPSDISSGMYQFSGAHANPSKVVFIGCQVYQASNGSLYGDTLSGDGEYFLHPVAAYNNNINVYFESADNSLSVDDTLVLFLIYTL